MNPLKNKPMMQPVSSWGRLTRDLHKVITLRDRQQAKSQLTLELPGLAHGMGRSYGDVCLNPQGVLWKTEQLDKLIAFDEETGLLICESGVLLKTIQEMFIPRGFMLPVTPGTQWVTVGGAIANDVHGKNHHEYGSFGHHVVALDLLRTTGELIQCDTQHNADWLSATIGGMGLTGVILSVTLQLRRISSPWLCTETLPFYDLDTFFKLNQASQDSWEYTVAWIDCLSRKPRGLWMRARHEASDRTPQQKKALTIPFASPISLMNTYSLRAFNQAYFRLHPKGMASAYYESFFYPLDHILHWNKLYGRQGFYQYQCVLPEEHAPTALPKLLAEIAKSKTGSFLAVLKTFGEKSSRGLMGFVMPQGVTLALDFVNQGEKTMHLFQRLDAIVLAAKGRLYCAKNAYMTPDLFVTGYPNLSKFTQYRDHGISSSLSRRLMGS